MSSPKPAFTDTEALWLARFCFGLPAAFAIAPLPSYDDQNMCVLNEAGMPLAAMKFAASGAECRGFAGEAETAAQLLLENDAMVRLSSNDVRDTRHKVSCPLPLSVTDEGPQNDDRRGLIGSTAVVTPEELIEESGGRSRRDSGILRVERPNGGDGVNFVRVLTWLAGSPLADWIKGARLEEDEFCAGKEASEGAASAPVLLPVRAHSGGGEASMQAAAMRQGPAPARAKPQGGHEGLSLSTVFAEFGRVTGRTVRLLAHNSSSAGAGSVGGVWVPAAARRQLTWDLANAADAAAHIPLVGGERDEDDCSSSSSSSSSGGGTAAHGAAENRQLLVKKWLDRFTLSVGADLQASLRSVSSAPSSSSPPVLSPSAPPAATTKGCLPLQVIHGDLNDYNVLVQDMRSPTGTGADDAATAAAPSLPSQSEPRVRVSILDFGDMVYTARVFDLAIALAYACQNCPNPTTVLEVARTVIDGYIEGYAGVAERESGATAPVNATQAAGPSGLPPLTEQEARILPTCVAARLCQSVATSAYAISQDPANAEYLGISAGPGWRLLWQWDHLDSTGALAQLSHDAAKKVASSPFAASLAAATTTSAPAPPPLQPPAGPPRVSIVHLAGVANSSASSDGGGGLLGVEGGRVLTDAFPFSAQVMILDKSIFVSIAPRTAKKQEAAAPGSMGALSVAMSSRFDAMPHVSTLLTTMSPTSDALSASSDELTTGIGRFLVKLTGYQQVFVSSSVSDDACHAALDIARQIAAALPTL